ncbi:MAG: hypothetical protein AMJ43_09235 [Coxiella sp. DG_40]|nr:MAG: hypothetical protein AMJ43_09235 [Coxiella sp. DG_40]
MPIYRDNVSNVFDFANTLLLIDIENGKETNRSEVVLGSQSLPQRAGQLKSLGVDVLVCGAISRILANMVTTLGIEVLPYVTGHVDNVLQAYMTGQLVRSEFSMPGCWPGARKGFRGWRRGRHWRGGR